MAYYLTGSNHDVDVKYVNETVMYPSRIGVKCFLSYASWEVNYTSTACRFNGLILDIVALP